MENNKVKNYLAEKELSDCIEDIFEDLNEYFNGVSFSTVEYILHNYKRDSLKSASVVSAKINS